MADVRNGTGAVALTVALDMTSALILGIDPHTVPGMDGDVLRAGLDRELARFGEHDIDAAMTLIALDDSAESTVLAALAEREWDVVVIGGGIRKPEPLLTLFEHIVNLIRRHAPRAAIAFNSSGGDSVEAAKRWL
ncbi:precorrin-6B methylase 2 [Streptacidiphilus sp. MAP5-52]